MKKLLLITVLILALSVPMFAYKMPPRCDNITIKVLTEQGDITNKTLSDLAFSALTPKEKTLLPNIIMTESDFRLFEQLKERIAKEPKNSPRRKELEQKLSEIEDQIIKEASQTAEKRTFGKAENSASGRRNMNRN